MNLTTNTQEYVVKRSGEKQPISFDKISNRIKNLGGHFVNNELAVNYTALTQKIIGQLYDGIKTAEIDELTSQLCASLSTKHPDYGTLASRVLISNHQKNTDDDYLKVTETLYGAKDIHGKPSPLIHENVLKIARIYQNQINEALDYDRDFLIDYFGFKTLERAYLIRVGNRVVERPQHMWMRVAIGIHGCNQTITEGDKTQEDAVHIDKILQTYHLMSQKYFTHATPTLFHAGTPRPQLSSCYLIAMEEDSIHGIYNTLLDCAMISKWAGGIGLHIHNIRANGSHIRGTNGMSNGIVPMLKVFNNTARYVDQGGGKRKGSFAIYLEPWHADIQDFLEMKKNHGDEEARARDLFYALWISDLFMQRVKDNGDWTLMCPDKCPGLSEAHGKDFEELYRSYEGEGRGNEVIKARDLWFRILDAQIETGTPYMLYKDACNAKTNQANLGTIKSSNLCCEIMEYSDKDETAVCNLASIGLSRFVDVTVKNKPVFDYEKLHSVVEIVVENLNKIIDVNFYPTEKTRRSNMRHRPVGLGVQGLADVMAMLDIPFHSEEARTINRHIFETIYHAALTASNEMSRARSEMIRTKREIEVQYDAAVAENDGLPPEWAEAALSKMGTLGLQLSKLRKRCPEIPEEKNRQGSNDADFDPNLAGSYSSFVGSPASKGILQFDMWTAGKKGGEQQERGDEQPKERYDWASLKASIVKYGLRNSLLVAPMPTASTSQILGNNECFEPFTSNIYVRRTLAGEFVMANKYLQRDLLALDKWTEEVKNSIIQHNGSVQQLDISQHLKDKYKTVWEIPMKFIIDMAADRGPYICQSQSLNLWMKDPTYDKLTAMHFYAWGKGLKTGIYYLRTKAKAAPQQFTIEPEAHKQQQEDSDDDDCLMCGS